jgi:hypothetical protein
MVGTHHSETLEIRGENAPLWWMTTIRMTKITGFPGFFACSKKGGYTPLPKMQKPLENGL